MNEGQTLSRIAGMLKKDYHPKQQDSNRLAAVKGKLAQMRGGKEKPKAGTPAGFNAGLWGQRIRSRGKGLGLGVGRGYGPIGRR